MPFISSATCTPNARKARIIEASKILSIVEHLDLQDIASFLRSTSGRFALQRTSIPTPSAKYVATSRLRAKNNPQRTKKDSILLHFPHLFVSLQRNNIISNRKGQNYGIENSSSTSTHRRSFRPLRPNDGEEWGASRLHWFQSRDSRGTGHSL